MQRQVISRIVLIDDERMFLTILFVYYIQCYTTGGFEMIRISVVDYKGTTILDELVKPKHEILDLNSRFRYVQMQPHFQYRGNHCVG